MEPIREPDELDEVTPTPPAGPPGSQAVAVRLPADVKAAAEQAAHDESRSLASLIEKLLIEHLRAAGYLASQHPEPR